MWINTDERGKPHNLQEYLAATCSSDKIATCTQTHTQKKSVSLTTNYRRLPVIFVD